MQRLIKYFVRGLIIILPVAISLYAVYWIISSIDSFLNLDRIMDSVFGKYNPFPNLHIPGLGIIAAMLLVLSVGVAMSHFITIPIQMWFNKTLNRIPLFRFIYSSTKDITEAFVGDEKKFSEPVLVTINETQIKRVGFVTKKDLNALGIHDSVAVYFPMSYSIAGNLYIVPKDQVKALDMKPSDAMKFVVSGGVVDW